MYWTLLDVLLADSQGSHLFQRYCLVILPYCAVPLVGVVVPGLCVWPRTVAAPFVSISCEWTLPSFAIPFLFLAAVV